MRVVTPAGALAEELRRRIDGEVRFDRGSRALYATDASNYRQIPIGVVLPRHAGDVVAAVEICREYDAPILPRGGGTSLAGQCCNAAVVLDCSKYLNRLLEIDPGRRLARVEPGVVLDDLRKEAERYGLTFGPDPATHDRCTIGGMIGNNSCGVHSIVAGKTDANVEELDILTYDGARMRVGRLTDCRDLSVPSSARFEEILSRLDRLQEHYSADIRAGFPGISRCVSGYNLPYLLPEHGMHVARALVGSEGTCVTALEATVTLMHSPPARALLVLGFRDIVEAADAVPEVAAHRPLGLEGFSVSRAAGINPERLAGSDLSLLPSGRGWLLVEFGAPTRSEAEDRARHLMEEVQQGSHRPTARLYDTADETRRVWQARETALGVAAAAPGEPETWPGWEDSAVAPEKLGGYLRDLLTLSDRYGYHTALYGHFGEGCVHARYDFDFRSAPGIAHFRSFMEKAAELVVSYGGSLSGEHGDGQARGELLPRMFQPRVMEAFREFKRIWDPAGRMNPGKLIDPLPLDRDLRLQQFAPMPVRTHFHFPEDGGSFAVAAQRCVGIGRCRKHDAGTMCPSYMVTGEEEHSTRGRARLLVEMLQGDPVEGGWRSDTVREALDLCLACKGCKSECPTHVDMATYKAEFLSHYYAGRVRPVTAYTLGLIHWWLRMGSLAPGLANTITQTPGLRAVLKQIGGIALERCIPALPPFTFQQWAARRVTRRTDRPRVILWPDTFNNHVHPMSAIAAVEVLESTGYDVIIPRGPLCCGRPLYDFGFLGAAKRQLGRVLDRLGPLIREGIPLVGLEPSCLAVFRDELTQLFPMDETARQLHDQSILLSELLERDGYQPGSLKGTALLQGHCHQKALMGMSAEETLLRRVGLDVTVLDSGCCGMAGAFGFERAHYDVAMACGERVLLPAVRAAAPETLVIADGFSCREQIAQATGRTALHLADVLYLALARDETR